MSTDLQTTSPTTQSLRFRLRDRTQAIHRRLDATLDAQGLMDTMDGYAAVLRRFVGLYRPLEAQLGRLTWAGSGIDIGQRLKSSWLVQDLRHLGHSEQDIMQHPDCLALPRLLTIHEGLGALYVLEGATLGGQVITRNLHNGLGIDAETGGRFFAAYGEKTGVMWRDFVTVLDRHGGDETAADVIEHTAIAVFRCFETWMADALPEAGESR